MHRTHKINPQTEWRALLDGFAAMHAVLGEETEAALLRFGCDDHLVAAVAAEWRRVHGERVAR
jgi:hypothetical protein